MKNYRTIKELVIDLYNSEGAMPSYEQITPLVRQYFPNSKWNKSHYAWYKSQIKTGKMSVTSDQSGDDDADEIDGDIEDSIEARVSMERDLHDYLSRHLSQLEPNLKLHDGGVEFPTEAGKVDILAVDNKSALVVIEIKAGRAKDSALGQILGYIGCLSSSHKGIRGILVASDFDERVLFASKNLPNIRLVKYTLNFVFDTIT